MKIVGIVLVKDEDLYIARVLSNISEFCDEIIVADNLSQDKTAQVVLGLHDKYPHIRYHSINKTEQSHELICGYAGENCWVFGVDGDEIYDPIGLSRLRKRIQAGDYDAYWMLLGNVLNCTEVDTQGVYARGYLAPPCRSMTKLYNFGAISAWHGPCAERLHGGTIEFLEGYDQKMRYELYKEVSWSSSDFRCLHLCFIRRSSTEDATTCEMVVRKNISDKLSERFWQRLASWVFAHLGMKQKSDWKKDKYMRGDLVERDIKQFFVNA